MKIIIKNLQKKISISPKGIRKTVSAVLGHERSKKQVEITICFVDDQQIRELNLMYLGEDQPTDVIAFDSSNKKNEIMADIVVSADTALANARIFKTTHLYELYLYVIHGLLHILGYNDAGKKGKTAMRKKEELVLKELNLSPTTYRL